MRRLMCRLVSSSIFRSTGGLAVGFTRGPSSKEQVAGGDFVRQRATVCPAVSRIRQEDSCPGKERGAIRRVFRQKFYLRYIQCRRLAHGTQPGPPQASEI